MDDQQQAIDAILGGMRRVAVVGISDNPARASNRVAVYLIGQGFTIFPVNPLLKRVCSLECHPGLKALPEPVEVVDVFRRSAEAGAVVDDAIEIGAKAVWLQEGVIDEAAAERARRAGLLVVMDRCMLKEHAMRAKRGGAFS